jgi:hypothetical protein
MKTLYRLLSLVAIAGLVGCSGGQGGASAPQAAPETPEAVVQRFFDSIKENRPQDIYALMPESYQKDLNSTIQAVASKVDPEVYNAAVALLKKGVAVLKSKKDMILGNDMVSQGMQGAPVDIEQVKQSYDDAISLLNTYVNDPQIATHADFAKFDLAKFVGTTGQELMEQASAIGEKVDAPAGEEMTFAEMRAKLNDIKISTVSQEAQSATVKVEMPGEEPNEFQLTKVGDRWIPTEMATDWEEGMKDFRSFVDGIEPMAADKKAQALQAFKTLTDVLNNIDSAKTQEEFNAAVQGSMFPVMGAGTNLMGAFSGAAPMEGPEGEGFDDSGFDVDIESPELQELPN